MLVHIASTFLAFVAFVFLLFAVIGDINNTPGISNIYYYRADFQTSGLFASISNFAGEPDFITFGLWTFCYGTYSAGVQYCSPPKLGYEIDSTGLISSILSQHTSIIDASMSKAIMGLFIPSIVLTFLALFPGALSYRSRLPNFIASVLTALAFLFTVITFIVVFVVFSMVNDEMTKLTSSIHGSVGNATWLTLGAAIALLLASAGFLFACCCGGGGRRRNTVAAADGNAVLGDITPVDDEEAAAEK